MVNSIHTLDRSLHIMDHLFGRHKSDLKARRDIWKIIISPPRIILAANHQIDCLVWGNCLFGFRSANDLGIFPRKPREWRWEMATSWCKARQYHLAPRPVYGRYHQWRFCSRRVFLRCGDEKSAEHDDYW